MDPSKVHDGRVYWKYSGVNGLMYLRTCASSEDSDQHAHLRNMIRIFTGLVLDSQWCKVSSCEQRRLIRLHVCAGLFQASLGARHITKTCLYNFDPLKPHFYIVKLGFTGVYIIFLILAQKHRLWVLVRTASMRRF